MNIIKILNDNKDIVATNYWESEEAELGLIGVSPNAGCFRLLLPKDWVEQIPSMLKDCDYAIVSRTNDIPNQGYALEVVFEDYSKSPYTILVSAAQMLPNIPSMSGHLMEGTLSIWINGPVKVAEMKAFYRKVPSLPWMKPLSRGHE